MKVKSDSNSTTSFAGEEYVLATPLVANTDESLYVDKPKALDTKYASLANLRQELNWNDSYFEDEDDGDVIAVFDFDYDNMEKFYTSLGWATLASTCLYTPFFMASLIGLVPCYLRQNVRWSTRSKHVAITQDGIRFVQERRPCCWGLPCSDKGKSSKTGTSKDNNFKKQKTKHYPKIHQMVKNFSTMFIVSFPSVIPDLC